MPHPNETATVYPFAFASPRHRLGARAIGALVACLSPLISLPWNWLAWGRSQTPGMNSLKLRIYSTVSGLPVTRGKMFQRQIGIPVAYCVVPGIYSALGTGLVSHGTHVGLGQLFNALADLMLLGIFLTDVLWIYKGDKRQRLRDVIAHTAVLNECIPTGSDSESSDT